MKYIVDASQTRRILGKLKVDFTLLHFFFDYRAETSASNHELGLVKAFISQLCQRFPDLEARLAHEHTHERIQEGSLERLCQMLRDALERQHTSVYAFIDGLDEYMGDYSKLALLLLRLQRQTGIRMCFASRPELAFQRAFQDYPQLIMQEYNAASVRAYIDHAIESAGDRLFDTKEVIDSSMRDEITRRANGMIIWSRLVVDQLLEAAQPGPRRTSLPSILHDLPDDLERMYDQTFNRVEDHGKAEAALLLYFINELGGEVDSLVLYGLWHFFYLEVLGRLPTRTVQCEQHFVSRVLSLCGSFIDVVVGERSLPLSKSLSKPTHSQQSEQGRKTDKSRAPVPMGSIRTLHKTLQSYIQRSEYIRSFIPTAAGQRYYTFGRASIYAHVISVASASGNFDVAEISREIQVKADNSSLAQKLMIATDSEFPEAHWCYRLLKNSKINASWDARLSLLLESIMKFPSVASSSWFRHALPPQFPFELWKEVLTSVLMSIEIASRTGFKETRKIFSERGELIDLRLAIDYGLVDYLREAFSQTSPPSASSCNWLLAEAVNIMWLDGVDCFAEDLVFAWVGTSGEPLSCSVKRRIGRRPRHLDVCMLQETIKCIHARCTAIHPNLLLHPCRMEIHMTTKAFEEKLGIYRSLLMSTQDLRIATDTESNVNLCTCQPRNHLLQAWLNWAVEASYEGEALESRNQGMWNKLSRDLTLETKKSDCEVLLLKILHRNDGNVNRLCDKHGTSLHFLIGKQGYSSYKAWRMSISLLVLLARLGADPTIRFKGKTPLEMLKRLRVQITAKAVAAIVLETEPVRNLKGLNAIQGILEYHESHGKWPDFEPVIKKYKLKWRALLQVTQAGEIVLDDHDGADREALLADQTQPSSETFPSGATGADSPSNGGYTVDSVTQGGPIKALGPEAGAPPKETIEVMAKELSLISQKWADIFNDEIWR